MPKIDYDKLLQNISIDEVAKRLGMELRQETPTQAKALCPFHDDKSPSLVIYSSRDHGRQHFYCFACGAHGDAIDLVKEQLKVGFKEAVDWLAPGAWSTAGRKHTTATSQFSTLRPDSRPGLELAYKLYQECASAADFTAWVSERHLDAAVLRRAGYVQASNNCLSVRLDSQQDASERREQAGLLEDAHLVRKLFPGVKADYHLPLNDHYTDFFIGARIIFPLYDQHGLLLGLGGRSVEQSNRSTPKYQFTRGFPKATVLYRAESAFKHIQSEAKQGKTNLSLYLCEGFLDALRLESLGMLAVAVMGSSISEQQVQLLHVLSDGLKDALLTVVVCFDRDEAGLRGAADTCLKLLRAPVECKFVWPTTKQLADVGRDPTHAKDPNDYLQNLSGEAAAQFIAKASHPPELAVLANAFGVSAEDTLNNNVWEAVPRSRRYRAFSRALSSLNKLGARGTEALVRHSTISEEGSTPAVAALIEWIRFVGESTTNAHPSLSEEFLNDAQARLNHARILAYMGSKRGELPCDEPRWERLDIAATAFNALLEDKLGSAHAEPIGPYDAVWVPRSFGGTEPRLKMMPRAEDLIIQQYLLNEILTERWDHSAFAETFSRSIPAVRYYREERRTVTTGFDAKGKGQWGEHGGRTLSFAYQIDMDVVEGRQPATDQGMYRPFIDCWRDFMKSLSEQATGIGYVYSIRLDVKRYYDRLRRYVVRDRLLSRLDAAIESVTGETPGFAELVKFETATPSAASKAATVLDRIDEQLFGVSYRRPDTGFESRTEELIGIPQGPVLSAWIGSVALFPVDEEAYRFMERLNTDRERVGYARYVDDIVLLADSPSTLMEMRDAIDRCARKLELMLVPKADEIPAMSAEDFSTYINQGRALAASGPAWEPPLIGDGESGWDFWSAAPMTDRQSALQLLHNVELYKASQTTLLQTVRTALQAPDLRASELSKAARLIWYSIACEQTANEEPASPAAVWTKFMHAWNECLQGASWQLQPEKNAWESPLLFALEGLEHLLDTTARDVAELSAEENDKRRKRIMWLANLALEPEFIKHSGVTTSSPIYQTNTRFGLVRWKALRIAGHKTESGARLSVERSKLVQHWHPFEWLHEAIALLSEARQWDTDPLLPFIEQTAEQTRQQAMSGVSAEVFKALLPEEKHQSESLSRSENLPGLSRVTGIALQTLVSIVPRDQLPRCLSLRPGLIWNESTPSTPNRLTLPPLPGISTSRLFCCLGAETDESGLVLVGRIEIIDFELKGDTSTGPVFIGRNGGDQIHSLAPAWHVSHVDGANASFVRFEADLGAADCLRLRERIQPTKQDVSVADLKKVATLFRAVAQIVMNYAQANDDKELVPAWPYIATGTTGQFYYLISDSVSRDELGNRAFVRDGGRALRTVEVPIFEAQLWRVGIAISDYLGLHDDVTKFSSAELDVTLDAAALANPARYVLRAQLRKLRGAYADSNVSKRRNKDSGLPASVERSLKLLECFPDEVGELLGPLFHVLAAEAESAGMYLSIRERWGCKDISAFLKALSGKLLARLPLSIGQVLATSDEKDKGIRRDLAGLLCFARRVFSANGTSQVAETQAWKVLCASVVCAGISSALDGLLASMRSHGAFERYANFDFPLDWEVPVGAASLDGRQGPESADAEAGSRAIVRVPLIEQLKRMVQHLGHRLHRSNDLSDRLSDQVIERLKMLTKTLLEIECLNGDADSFLEWPFAILSCRSLDLLNLELLETVAALAKEIDKELGFEVVLVIEPSYGYNAQTRRFTNSRSGVCEVTPWMISQFPRSAKHIEEINRDGRFLRVWSEVFDRRTNKLLSVSALGEPFASIAVGKPELDVSASKGMAELQASLSESAVASPTNNPMPADAKETNAPDGVIAALVPIMLDRFGSKLGESIPCAQPESELVVYATGSEGEAAQIAYEFRKRQMDQWGTRGGRHKNDGHVRVALLQADLDLTFTHPFVEACPSNWPFSAKAKALVIEQLKSHRIYKSLLSAATRPDSAHFWKGLPDEVKGLPSWAEHRRQRILSRVIDTCEAFGVDLLILPEYSVRIETIKWLKIYLAKKKLAVLAGTYMEFRQQSDVTMLTAPLKLLWPVPKTLSDLLAASVTRKEGSIEEAKDFVQRGLVLEFSRQKKYRSIALDEFFRPASGRLVPLFVPSELPIKLKQAAGFEFPPNVLIELLAGTRLPLKHFLELICSEVFLVSNPANYLHMYEDLLTVRRRFGEVSEPDEVFIDVKALSQLLSITGDGVCARRSILAVPAATSRSADYWIAGQASFLAAGTTTVFCNSVDGKTFVGGSCFIGKGSWKTDEGATGYISRITPYHGWSKGIFYNHKKDALSDQDQAVVIADIDPHNMLEGKPRAQTMPSPLQLVAYLPISISVNWANTEKNVLRELAVPEISDSSNEKVEGRPQDEESFWRAVQDARTHLSEENLRELWSKFPDEKALSSRATAYANNGDMQPSAPHSLSGLFSTPALYDWIDVSLTLTDQQELPKIDVPPWRK